MIRDVLVALRYAAKVARRGEIVHGANVVLSERRMVEFGHVTSGHSCGGKVERIEFRIGTGDERLIKACESCCGWLLSREPDSSDESRKHYRHEVPEWESALEAAVSELDPCRVEVFLEPATTSVVVPKSRLLDPNDDALEALVDRLTSNPAESGLVSDHARAPLHELDIDPEECLHHPRLSTVVCRGKDGRLIVRDGEYGGRVPFERDAILDEIRHRLRNGIPSAYPEDVVIYLRPKRCILRSFEPRP